MAVETADTRYANDGRHRSLGPCSPRLPTTGIQAVRGRCRRLQVSQIWSDVIQCGPTR